MEHTGLEPVASTLPVWRAPNCANAPCEKYYTIKRPKCKEKYEKDGAQLGLDYMRKEA